MPSLQKQLQPLALSKKTQDLVELEHKYTAGGFKPMPAFFVEGKGAKLWVRSNKIRLQRLNEVEEFANPGLC
jgi:hypothetical protein